MFKFFFLRFDGAFNISWLGKFYFLISAIISLLLTYFTNFLSSECMTYYLLKLVLISIGCYYLESSTSSVELSIFLIIFFTNEHHISHLFWKVYIYFAASHPTVKYSGRKVRTYVQSIILFFYLFYVFSIDLRGTEYPFKKIVVLRNSREKDWLQSWYPFVCKISNNTTFS